MRENVSDGETLGGLMGTRGFSAYIGSGAGELHISLRLCRCKLLNGLKPIDVDTRFIMGTIDDFSSVWCIPGELCETLPSH